MFGYEPMKPNMDLAEHRRLVVLDEETLLDELFDCAVAGNVERAFAVRAALERDGTPVGVEEHLMILLAHQISGRAEEAEAYFRSLPTLFRSPVQLHAVMGAYMFAHRSDDVVRVFEELEYEYPPADDLCRGLLLSVLGGLKQDDQARAWFRKFEEESDGPVSPELIGALIMAHDHPGARDELDRIHDELDPVTLYEPEVLSALVYAYSRAGARRIAAHYLGPALAAVDDTEAREDLIAVCNTSVAEAEQTALRRRLADATDAGSDPPPQTRERSN